MLPCERCGAGRGRIRRLAGGPENGWPRVYACMVCGTQWSEDMGRRIPGTTSSGSLPVPPPRSSLAAKERGGRARKGYKQRVQHLVAGVLRDGEAVSAAVLTQRIISSSKRYGSSISARTIASCLRGSTLVRILPGPPNLYALAASSVDVPQRLRLSHRIAARMMIEEGA